MHMTRAYEVGIRRGIRRGYTFAGIEFGENGATVGHLPKKLSRFDGL